MLNRAIGKIPGRAEFSKVAFELSPRVRTSHVRARGERESLGLRQTYKAPQNMVFLEAVSLQTFGSKSGWCEVLLKVKG